MIKDKKKLEEYYKFYSYMVKVRDAKYIRFKQEVDELFNKCFTKEELNLMKTIKEQEKIRFREYRKKYREKKKELNLMQTIKDKVKYEKRN
jgi:hypothetical protein